MILQPSSSSENYQQKSPMQKSEIDSVESELSDARKAVRELAFKIEEANSRSRRKPKWREHGDSETSIKIEDARYTQVMEEMERMKQELSRLKVDMARVLKEKRRAERSSKASSSKKATLSASIELMKKEIQELNEEQAIVEFARIEAVKERESTEDHKPNVEHNDLQLAVSDLDLKQEGSPLNTITDELECAKRELASIKGEGFHFMTSMDVIRDELKHVRDETSRLQKAEQKRELTVQNLNSKILRAKAKLESLTSAESRTNKVASNLLIALEQLRAEFENSKKDKELIDEEIENMNEEIRKTDSEIEVTGEELEAAMEELKAVKLTESKGLRNLKILINTTVEARDIDSINNSMITITDFEYVYLTGKAVRAAELADMKIGAAQAWVEALKAHEKEILMKVEMTQKEINEMSVEVYEEEEVDGPDLEEVIGPDLRAKVVASPRRSVVYRVGSSVKRPKLQRLQASMGRKSGSLKREKVMPKLTRLFTTKSNEMGV